MTTEKKKIKYFSLNLKEKNIIKRSRHQRLISRKHKSDKGKADQLQQLLKVSMNAWYNYQHKEEHLSNNLYEQV